jgi:hypothetical protein
VGLIPVSARAHARVGVRLFCSKCRSKNAWLTNEMFVKLDKLCVYGLDQFFRKKDACTGHTRPHPGHSGESVDRLLPHHTAAL